MLTLLSLYTCHTVRPLKLSTQVLVLELTLLTSMPALLSVYRLQIAVCTVHSENWYVVLCAAQCALYTECNVQQPVYLQLVHCAATGVLSLYSVQQLVFVLCAATCALCTVQCAATWPSPVVGLATACWTEWVTHWSFDLLHALSVLAFDSLQCWCWTLFECCHMLFHWYLVLSSTQDHRMWYRAPLCPKAGNADQARCAFEWTAGWVQQRPGRDTRSPDKVARNYAVILWQPGPGPTHPLTFWARSTFPIHSKMCGFQMSPSLKLLQSVMLWSEIHCRPV